jgi:hypothetical protein
VDVDTDSGASAGAPEDTEHFRPTGTITVLAMFVATLILLWLSVYLILIARGVTT